jgi:hypothetical protein
MSTTLAAFGLRPIRHISGESARQTALGDGIVTGYSANILSYQPVKFDTAGVIQAAAAGDAFIGTFLGCEYTTSDGQRVQTTNWVSGTSYVAGSLTAYYTSDPNLVYEIQADGSVAQTAIGGQANISNATSGSSTIGFSQATMNSSVTGAGSTAQLRILGLSTIPGNAWGDTYTIVEVQIATHQFVANINAI